MGGVQATSDSWPVPAPDTSFTAYPLNAYEPRPRFAFIAFGASALECQLDAEPWTACGNSLVLDGWTYPNGAHTFAVRGVNAWGPDPTPASRSWTHTRPDTLLNTAPPEYTTQASATFTFGGYGSGSAIRYECSLDGQPFATCTSPRSYSSLVSGLHSFQVRMVITDSLSVESAD